MDRLTVERNCQISESHCGPAVIQMLLAYLDVPATQEQITSAAESEATIAEHGTRVDQLAQAVAALAPHLQLWSKDHASADDLREVVDEHHYPAGVEWQGIFEDGDEDAGHYSVVTHLDPDTGEIWIADPYQDYYAEDRVLPLSVFVERWWDTNEVQDPRTGRPRLAEDYHMMFIVTPLDVTFPASIGMNKYSTPRPE